MEKNALRVANLSQSEPVGAEQDALVGQSGRVLQRLDDDCKDGRKDVRSDAWRAR